MATGWRGQYQRYKEFFLNIADLYKKRPDLKMFLEVILSLSTVIIFLIFALKPTILTIIELTKEIKEREETVAKLDSKISNLRSARSAYDSVSESLEILKSAIPNSPVPQTLASQIEFLAAKNGVSVLGISIDEVPIEGEAKQKKTAGDLKPIFEDTLEAPITMSVSGQYSSLVSFIRDMENARRPLKIDILGISSSVSDAGVVIVAVITGRVPYLK